LFGRRNSFLANPYILHETGKILVKRAIADTVVITCCLNTRSATSRLFLAIRMYRLLALHPKPRNSGCVNVNPTPELVARL
jgi:hypothetical protein